MINGTKAWVTFGGVADRIMVFAKHRHGGRTPRHQLLPGRRRPPGIARGKNEELLGMHGLEDCQITFDDVRMPGRQP